MRRRWGLASFLFVSTVGPVAFAQSADGVVAEAPDPEPAETAPQVVGYGGLPGGLWAPSAEVLPQGNVQLALLGGFGLRNDLLQPDSGMKRTSGHLAVGYGITKNLSAALSFDGRYDKHKGGQDGYVGDPHLLVRASTITSNLVIGGQVDLWVPGKDAPSIAGSAVSVAAQGLLSIAAGPGLLSFNAGFRLDNSAKSAKEASTYAPEDQVSLGVSEFNAFIAGAHLSIPVGPQAYVAAEGQADVFIGDGDTRSGQTMAHSAPSPIVRFGAEGGFHINHSWTALAYVEGARVPKITPGERNMDNISLVPYEATVSFGLGLQGRFGGGEGSKPLPKPIAIAEDVNASVNGDVVDDTGAPVVGAKVDVKTKTHEASAATDDKGHYVVDKIFIGSKKDGKVSLETDLTAEVSVDVSGKKPGRATFTLKEGDNAAPKMQLDPVLPPGQLRAVVRNAGNGKPIAGATVKIEGGPTAGATATSSADGTFQVDLQPGSYKITVSAAGLKDQELDVTIDPNGVAIKNIEMR
ncbi:MAG TPA: carboxypeptidase regulatory-like domain-containing protein [Kofleriaceae bacterium]